MVGLKEPIVCERARRGAVSQIFVAGDQTGDSGKQLADLIDDVVADPTIKMIWLNLEIWAAEASFALRVLPALTIARQTVETYFYLKVGCGPVLYLAAGSELICAGASAPIGYTGFFFPDSPAETSEEILAANEQSNLVLRLAKPKVAPNTWQRLEQSAVPGEQAEALGILYGLLTTDFMPNINTAKK